MAKFNRKGKGGMPAISTASLPDIVFMLLFFFMVATVMRETEQKVEVSVPVATQIKKLERKKPGKLCLRWRADQKVQSNLWY